MATSGSILGNAVRRLEDPTLLTGEGKYVDDLVEPGMLHVAFVRSTIAHAKLLSVDVSEAASMPGVVAVYHAGGDDLGLAALQQFPMMPRHAEPAGVRHRTRCASSATSSPRSWPRRVRRRPTPPRR